ncbi:Down syndrome cell adhesion molecule-like protein 1 homolog [Penaeus japonicus]|uniref:Down syndrome cell adhesion molecule-like protein 1 homolog n=1 Tax=Penaeus japonicus TaxID=27405 RepID=UPI001C71394E|nr:Down syndrome cell adhesion molecule-like protein 1 homolog [Penaeus japonicus]
MDSKKVTAAIVLLASCGFVTSYRGVRASIITGTFIELKFARTPEDSIGNSEDYVKIDCLFCTNSSQSILTTESNAKNFTDLQPGTPYTFMLTPLSRRAQREIGNKNPLKFQTARLRVEKTRPTLIQVAWSDEFKNLGADPLTYRVEWNITSRALSSNYLDIGNTVNKVTGNKIQYLRVPYYCKIIVCVQCLQESEWSSQVCGQVMTSPGMAGNVRNLKITPDERSLNLTWQDPYDNPPTGNLADFVVSVSNTSRNERIQYRLHHYEVPDVVGWRTFTVEGLQPDSFYVVKIGVTNNGYNSSNSLLRNVRTLPGVPSPPQLVLAVPNNITQVILTWVPTAEPQGVLVNYTIKVDGTVRLCQEDTLLVQRCQIYGLTPGQNHRFEVAACNRRHCSRYSANEVAMPPAEGLPVWILVLLTALLLTVFLLVPFLYWRGKRLVDHLVEIKQLAADANGQPGGTAVSATSQMFQNQKANDQTSSRESLARHDYESPYTLGVRFEPQASQAISPCGQSQERIYANDAEYVNLSGIRVNEYENVSGIHAGASSR